MNDEEFGSVKLLKFKYRRREQKIQTFCKIGSPQKLGPHSYLLKFEDSEKSTPESSRMP